MRPSCGILVSWLLVMLWCVAPALAGFKPDGDGSPGVLPSVAPILPVVPQPPAFSPAPPPGVGPVPGQVVPQGAPPMVVPPPGAPVPSEASPSPGPSPLASPPVAASPRPAPVPVASPRPQPPSRPTGSSPWVPILVVVVLFFVWLLPTREWFGKPPREREERSVGASLEIPRMRLVGKPPRTKPPT